MSIVTTTSRMTKNNPTTKFSIRLNEDETVEFRPTGTFAHVTTEQVLKIVTKADVDVTAENNKNKVNFKLTGKDKLFGFLNYFDNDLSDESVSTEVKAVLKDVKSALSTVELGDITLPMTAGQADDLINGL